MHQEWFEIDLLMCWWFVNVCIHSRKTRRRAIQKSKALGSQRLTKLILSSTNSPHFLTLPEIWDISEPANISSNLPKKMAAVGSKRKRSIPNYKDLNEISSVVLYDTARKGKGKFFEVDRLIEKRKVGHVSTTCQNEMIYLIFCYFLGWA